MKCPLGEGESVGGGRERREKNVRLEGEGR